MWSIENLMCYPEQALSPSGGKVLHFSLLSSVLEETVWSALTWPALLTVQLNLVSLYATFLPNFTSHTWLPTSLVFELSALPQHTRFVGSLPQIFTDLALCLPVWSYCCFGKDIYWVMKYCKPMCISACGQWNTVKQLLVLCFLNTPCIRK